VNALLFCQSQGKTLPTEAQLEYLVGGVEGHRYVWGDDDPGCADAVWGRDGFGILSTFLPNTCLDRSNFLGLMGGPEPPPHGARDVLSLRTGVVYDLVGNVDEWAVDDWEEQQGPCWAASGILVDPQCHDSNAGFSSRRGGDWRHGGSLLESSVRSAARLGGMYTGFRCARADR
jgi:formylglycine-generating enzyme required for sulfatase activity